VHAERWVPGSIATVALLMINSVRRCVTLSALSAQPFDLPARTQDSGCATEQGAMLVGLCEVSALWAACVSSLVLPYLASKEPR
jgi:hypothetical protein